MTRADRYRAKSIGNHFSTAQAKRANAALLVTHAALLVAFLLLQVWIMVVVNVCGIAAYLLFFHAVCNRIDRFMLFIHVEVIVHMILAIMCLGWEYGFQLYCFALATTAFFGMYLSRRSHQEDSDAMLFVTAMAVLFIILRIITLRMHPWYELPYAGLDVGFFCANAVITFTFIIYYMSIFARVVTESERRLEHDAEIDSLTSLANRSHMSDITQIVFAEAEENNAAAAVALIDVDDFKRTNDTFGHDAGDYVLSVVAHEIGMLQDTHVHVGRWGGEEFIVVAVGVDAYPKLRARLQALVSRVAAKKFEYEDHEVSVTMTCGVTSRNGAEPFEESLKRADSLMYIGKARGKNCLVGDENTRR